MNTVSTKSSEGENFYLYGVEGKVKSVLTKYKAILTFERDDKEETAVLFGKTILVGVNLNSIFLNYSSEA